MKKQRQIKTKTITYADIEWEVLKEYKDKLLCISKDVLFNKAFDKDSHNNWSKSSLREYLNNEWFNNLPKDFQQALIPFKRDLTADNGLKDYGTCIDKVSLLSIDEYRKYRYSISNKSDWWWLITPWSCYDNATHTNGSLVRFVNSSGTVVNDDAFYGNNGVCPVILLDKSKI